MMACTNCETAARVPHWEFTAGCRGCCARSIARSPEFDAARRAGGRAGTPEVRKYLALLDQIGNLVKPPVTHDEVKAANAADAARRDAKPTTTNTAQAEGATT